MMESSAENPPRQSARSWHLRSLQKMALLLFAAQVLTLFAHAAITIPELSRGVIDSGNFMSVKDALTLEELTHSLRAADGPQIQIWTIPSLEGEAIESLSIRAATQWKLGHPERDDGLLLLLAAREKRIRIEVGQGLEGTLPDIVAFRHIEGILRPALRAQQPARGIYNWILEVARLTSPQWQPNESSRPLSQSVQFSGKLIFSLLFMFLVLARVLSGIFGNPLGARIGNTGRWNGASGSRTFGNSGFGGWHGGGRSGGSGGGWSGGGGGFSGGGSSGGW